MSVPNLSPSLLTTAFSVSQAALFVSTVGTEQAPQYYAFLAECVPTQTNAVPDAFDDTLTTEVGVYRNLIAGKIVTPTDVCQVIPNIPYVVNTAYDMYDDGNPLFFGSSFFAIVNAGSYYHVWKVLDNNMGANSTVAPNISDIDATDEVYETSDGYRWKYMYSVSTFTAAQFSTTDWFPLVPNTEVSVAAVDGAIDVIQVENAGQGYNNWITGTFASQDILVSGNTLLFAITGNSSANQIPSFYTGSILYISSGTGAGSFETITDSFSNPNGTFVVIANPLIIPPQNGSQYEIYPEVVVASAGVHTVNARARALVNSIGNSIYRVEMLERGANYRYITANVVANGVVGVVAQANVRPIYGPFGGHGFDAAMELGATGVSVAVTFANTESNTIPATNDYQQIGLMTAPLFNNVVVNVAANTIPLYNEPGFVIQNNRFLSGHSVVASEGNNIITSANGTADRFDIRIANTDVLYLQSSDGSATQLVNVVSVQNSSYLTLSQNALWSCTSTQIYLANLSSGFLFNGTLTTPNTWILANVVPSIEDGDLLIFENTGTSATVTGITRSGVVKGFDTFLGMYSYTATSVSGTFSENEIVTQGNATATLFASIANGGLLNIYTSNQVGQFTNTALANTITGSNSGAVASLESIWNPESHFGSGLVLYLENLDAIDRSEDVSDNLTFVFEF